MSFHKPSRSEKFLVTPDSNVEHVLLSMQWPAVDKLSMMNSAAVSVCAWCVHQLDRILRITSFTEVDCTCLYADL
jgi:hypothetical protein